MVAIVRRVVLTILLLWLVTIIRWTHVLGVSPLFVTKWWCRQWFPNSLLLTSWWSSNELIKQQQQQQEQQKLNESIVPILDLPEIDVENSGDDILDAVEKKYGANWRSKPLLLRNMWTSKDLDSDRRRLSLKGLLKERMVVPYFTNVSRSGALIPDGKASIGDIVANISTKSLPHKIGTQLLAKEHPELVYEVAPNHIVTRLFGNFFTPTMVRGFLNGWIQPLTAIPLFVAKSHYQHHSSSHSSSQRNDDTCSQQHDEQPRTDMHCEPIANILVQLEGSKRMTLISPEHSFRLQPQSASDGRAYIYSNTVTFDHIPRYMHVIQKGDAMYIPTWTWHRVDYDSQENDIAISGSLFHFRPLDFFRRNPFFAAVIIPNLMMELTGLKDQ